MYHYYRDRWTLTLTLFSQYGVAPPLSPRAARARACVKKEQWRSPHKMSAAEGGLRNFCLMVLKAKPMNLLAMLKV